MTSRIAGLILAMSLVAALPAQEAPATLDSLLQTARTSYAKGDYKAAQTSLEQAPTLAEQTPPDDPRRYDVWKQFYSVLSALGQYTDAESYLQRAINWRENNLGKEHPKVAEDMTELAMLCRSLKDIPRGLDILGIVNSMYRRTAGPQSSQVADTFSRMALLQKDDKKPEAAAVLLRMAIGIRENLLGADHVGLLPELSRLGSISVDLREYENAEQIYRRALVIHERAVGPANPDLIPTVEGLAYACFGQKKFAEAEPLYQRLLALWESAGGKDHPMVALTLDKIAVFYREQARREESDVATLRSNAIRALFYATGLSEEAYLHLINKEKDEAGRIYQLAAGVLDPARPEHKELLSQIENNLKELGATVPAPAAIPAKKGNSKSARKTKGQTVP